MSTMTDGEKSARVWLLSRGYIHPSSMVSIDTMHSEREKLSLLVDSRKSEDIQSMASRWMHVWGVRIIKHKTLEFGQTDGRGKTKGRSPKKAAKSQKSREEYDRKQKDIPKRSEGKPGKKG